ncbi:MAG: hypothetical protein GX075_09595 [Firmicutes bacterium]|nr:hypothetical protein [Bacillota bacterium]
MKRGLIFIIILTISLGAFSTPAAGAVSLHRIAVMPFDDGSIKKTWGEQFDLGKGVADELVTALLETNRFRLVEREEVDKVLEEQNLGKDGLLDPQTAAKIGKILGVQYLVIGRVTDFSIKEDEDILANPNRHNWMGMRVTFSTAFVSLEARLVDTTTAEILTSVTGSGRKKTVNLGLISEQGGISFGDKDFEKSDLGKALRQAVTSAARQLATKAYGGLTPVTITGMVAYVMPDRIIINVGRRDGVEPGMVFKVAHKITTLKDPVTNEAIGEVTEPVAEISVVEVKEKSATCVILNKLSEVYEIAVADPVESKTPLKIALPELPPLKEEEEGYRRGNEFRLYTDWMALGELTDKSLPEGAETKNSSVAFIGAQAILGRFKLALEKSFHGEIKDSTREPKISEAKLGYNLNPAQDVQIELFVSKLEMEAERGGTDALDWSSWVFGADVEYEMAEKTIFELSYGYGASNDYRINGVYQAGGNLGIIKAKISYYFSKNTAAYLGYRSYMLKMSDVLDLTGVTAGLVLKF